MAPSYTARLPLPDMIVQGRGHKLTCPVYRDGALVAPVSAAVTVYDATDTAVVSSAVATVTDSVATYEVAGALTSGLIRSTGWRVEWALEMPDGSIITPRNTAALVRTHIYPVITDADITARVPALDLDKNRKLNRSANYQWAIDESFLEIQQWLLDQGNRPNLIVAPSALRSVHLYLALSLIFADMSTTGSDSYGTQAATYREMYREARSALTLDYDEDDDGRADQRRPANPTLWLC